MYQICVHRKLNTTTMVYNVYVQSLIVFSILAITAVVLGRILVPSGYHLSFSVSYCMSCPASSGPRNTFLLAHTSYSRAPVHTHSDRGHMIVENMAMQQA